MTHRFALPFALLALAALIGCSESSTVEDMAIRFDASPQPDLGPPDLGPLPPGPGDSCTSAADCETGECIGEWPDGYCTSGCSTNEDCGERGTCVEAGRGSNICLVNCDPETAEPCRAGYGCTSDPRIGNVCIPGCTEDADCSGGAQCDVTGGQFGEGSCFDPESSIGDACGTEEECPAGGFCLAEDFAGWPAGACISGGCDYGTGMGCPDGAVCAEGGGGGFCLAGCETSDDCRDEYACEADPTHPERMSCRPACTSDDACAGGSVCNPALGTCDAPFEDGQLGDSCDRSGGCTGGTCLREFDTGLPGAFCTYVGCTVGADAEDGCPDDGVCVEGEEDDLCFAGCETSDDCRDGYACRAVDPDDATRGMGCFAACENDAVCANDGFSCNVGTGLCTEPFQGGRLGEPCEDVADDCPGGLCLAEAEDGWPAGTCAAPGCPLTGTATGQPCPTDGVCVDDEDGDDLGLCLSACSTEDATACRPGYGCEAIEGTDGACRPACEGDGDCGSGRTCDTDTGLCVAS